MEENSEIWYSYPEIRPTKIEPLEVLTSYGIRQVMANHTGGIGGYIFTDCTHPMQNMNCNMCTIDGWRYKDFKLNTTENIKVFPSVNVSFADGNYYEFMLAKPAWYVKVWCFLKSLLHPKTAKA